MEQTEATSCPATVSSPAPQLDISPPVLPVELIILIATHLQHSRLFGTLASLTAASGDCHALITPLLYETVHLTCHSASVFAPHRRRNSGSSTEDLLLPPVPQDDFPLPKEETESRLLDRLKLIKQLIVHQPPPLESGITSHLRRYKFKPPPHPLLLPNLQSLVLTSSFVGDIMAGPPPAVEEEYTTDDPIQLEDYGTSPPSPALPRHTAATSFLSAIGEVCAPRHVCVALPPVDLSVPDSLPHALDNEHLSACLSLFTSQVKQTALDAGCGPGVENLTYHNVWKHMLCRTSARRHRAFFISRTRSNQRRASYPFRQLLAPSLALESLAHPQATDYQRQIQLFRCATTVIEHRNVVSSRPWDMIGATDGIMWRAQPIEAEEMTSGSAAELEELRRSHFEQELQMAVEAIIAGVGTDETDRQSTCGVRLLGDDEANTVMCEACGCGRGALL